MTTRDSMKTQRLQLVGLDRVKYFVPTGICVYLAVLCLLLIVTSAFLSSVQNMVAVAVAGAFGMTLTGALGYFFWKTQRRDLLYQSVATSADSLSCFAVVRAAAIEAGWQIVHEVPGERLDAQTAVLLLNVGERIVVQFRLHEVLVASISDPSVGFSLVGRRHCAEHRELVRQAVTGISITSGATR